MLKRFQIAVLLAAVVSIAGTAVADTVAMRTGKHADYTRLVFDWDETVQYSVKKDGADSVVISFQKDASVDPKTFLNQPLPNIRAVTLVSSSPLSIKVGIPEGSRIRDLRAGQKVVVEK